MSPADPLAATAVQQEAMHEISPSTQPAQATSTPPVTSKDPLASATAANPQQVVQQSQPTSSPEISSATTMQAATQTPPPQQETSTQNIDAPQQSVLNTQMEQPETQTSTALPTSTDSQELPLSDQANSSAAAPTITPEATSLNNIQQINTNMPTTATIDDSNLDLTNAPLPSSTDASPATMGTKLDSNTVSSQESLHTQPERKEEDKASEEPVSVSTTKQGGMQARYAALMIAGVSILGIMIGGGAAFAYTQTQDSPNLFTSGEVQTGTTYIDRAENMLLALDGDYKFTISGNLDLSEVSDTSELLIQETPYANYLTPDYAETTHMKDLEVVGYSSSKEQVFLKDDMLYVLNPLEETYQSTTITEGAFDGNIFNLLVDELYNNRDAFTFQQGQVTWNLNYTENGETLWISTVLISFDDKDRLTSMKFVNSENIAYGTLEVSMEMVPDFNSELLIPSGYSEAGSNE